MLVKLSSQRQRIGRSAAAVLTVATPVTISRIVEYCTADFWLSSRDASLRSGLVALVTITMGRIKSKTMRVKRKL